MLRWWSLNARQVDWRLVMTMLMMMMMEQQQQRHCEAGLHCSMTGRHALASLYAVDEFLSRSYYTLTHTQTDRHTQTQMHTETDILTETDRQTNCSDTWSKAADVAAHQTLQQQLTCWRDGGLTPVSSGSLRWQTALEHWWVSTI